MKRYVFLSLFLLISVFVFSQPSFTVTVNPQILPPQAPFTIYVDSNSHNLSGISVVATCDGISQTARSFPAELMFSAPTLKKGQSQKRLVVKVMILTKDGKRVAKDVSVIVYNAANPVITIGKASPSNNGYISKTVSFPIKVYAGFGVSEVDFMIDKRVVNSKSELSTQMLGVYSKTYKINTEKIKLTNGWHTFSVKVISVTGQVYSKITSYYVNNKPPIIKLSKIAKCLAAGTCVRVNTKILSPIGVHEVDVNGQAANRSGKNTWNARITTPATTGKWILNVVASDLAGNTSSTRVSVYVDGQKPTVRLTKDAIFVEGSTFLKRGEPLSAKIFFSTFSERCGIKPEVTVKWKNSKGEIVSKSISVKISTPDMYTVEATVMDLVNNEKATLNKKFSVKFYDTPPQISDVKILPDSFKTKDGEIVVKPGATLTVKAKVIDASIGVKHVSVNGVDASLKDGSYFVKINLKAEKSGLYPLNIKATDYLGNISNRSTFVFVDENPPTITCTLWPDNSLRNGVYWSKRNVPFYIGVKAVTDSKVDPMVKCDLNGKSFSEATLVSMSGTYVLSCVAKNPVNGKSSKRSKTLKLGFDNVPPDISSIDVPATLGPNKRFRVSVNARDEGIGVKYVRVNDELMKNQGKDSWCATLTTPDWNTSKKWNLKISAVDKFGNVEVKKMSVFIDAGLPTIRFYVGNKEIPNGFEGVLYFKSKPVLKYTAFTDGKVKAEVDVFLDCSEGITLPLKISGIHFVKAEAVDPISGKKASFNAKLFIAVDNEPPYVDIDSSQNINVTQTNRVKITVKDSHLRYSSFEVKLKNKIIYSKLYTKNEDEKVVDLKKVLAGINGQDVELILTAEDLCGNISSVTKHVYVDTMPPYIQDVHFEKGELTIKFSEPVFGKPYVKVVRNGKIIWDGIATISNSGDFVVAKPNVKLSFNTYEVEIKNVTDKVGNKIGNNFAPWSF